MSYHYNFTYSRWMPTLLAAPMAPLQTLIGTSGLTPTTTGVVPAAAAATDILLMLTNKNINMDVPPDPPSDSMEDEMMAASGGP